ncbi:hypothetical protein CYLTODRAFT_459709 [Cylindrobasidium torrendii FP15055 ss-10]|uniref:Uncharacterized protein n=1 Tax=Cylindrobasidium torrendii FP15055 ss-10 TaxID=1314674 RepID=A0A0D7ATD1_9AGAR|nr:hypothetical protein CYLTODRAFT_459709 [Cylindrobasidium torrendii FP15055 ss-10]
MSLPTNDSGLITQPMPARSPLNAEEAGNNPLGWEGGAWREYGKRAGKLVPNASTEEGRWLLEEMKAGRPLPDAYELSQGALTHIREELLDESWKRRKDEHGNPIPRWNYRPEREGIPYTGLPSVPLPPNNPPRMPGWDVYTPGPDLTEIFSTDNPYVRDQKQKLLARRQKGKGKPSEAAPIKPQEYSQNAAQAAYVEDVHAMEIDSPQPLYDPDIQFGGDGSPTIGPTQTLPPHVNTQVPADDFIPRFATGFDSHIQVQPSLGITSSQPTEANSSQPQPEAGTVQSQSMTDDALLELLGLPEDERHKLVLYKNQVSKMGEVMRNPIKPKASSTSDKIDWKLTKKMHFGMFDSFFHPTNVGQILCQYAGMLGSMSGEQIRSCFKRYGFTLTRMVRPHIKHDEAMPDWAALIKRRNVAKTIAPQLGVLVMLFRKQKRDTQDEAIYQSLQNGFALVTALMK